MAILSCCDHDVERGQGSFHLQPRPSPFPGCIGGVRCLGNKTFVTPATCLIKGLFNVTRPVRLDHLASGEGPGFLEPFKYDSSLTEGLFEEDFAAMIKNIKADKASWSLIENRL